MSGMRRSLADAVPGIELRWLESNSVPPDEVPASSTVEYALACDSCGEAFTSRPVNLCSRKEPFLCRHCQAVRSSRGPLGRAVPVTCVDTGERFPSIKDAARWLTETAGARPVCDSSVSEAIRHGYVCYGYRFEYADPAHSKKLGLRKKRRGRSGS